LFPKFQPLGGSQYAEVKGIGEAKKEVSVLVEKRVGRLGFMNPDWVKAFKVGMAVVKAVVELLSCTCTPAESASVK